MTNACYGVTMLLCYSQTMRFRSNGFIKSLFIFCVYFLSDTVTFGQSHLLKGLVIIEAVIGQDTFSVNNAR